MISFIVGYVVFCFIALCIGVAISVFVDGRLLVKDLVYMFIYSVTPIVNVVVILFGIVVLCTSIPYDKILVELIGKEIYKK